MNLQDLRAQMPNFDTYQDWRRPDPIESILVHHSGPGTVDATGNPALAPLALATTHVREEGRAHVGYHYAVDRAGTVFYLLDEAIAGYHAALPAPPPGDQAAARRWRDEWLQGQSFNRRSVALLLLGWFDAGRQSQGRTLPDNATTPSPAQWQALVELVQAIRQRHSVPLDRVEGHREALARAGFGSTGCPGATLDMAKLRAAVGGEATPEASATAGPVVVAGSAPVIEVARNRPLVGLHARNDARFTETDWQIIRQGKIESLKTMSFTEDSVYAQARQIDPAMEFIVRLYPGGSGRGHVPPPQEFADRFRDMMERLHASFGVLKFEIHNEPNHNTGLEGWGDSRDDALAFQSWYKQTFAILRQRHPWALLGYPGLAVPHNDLEWLDWNREAIEMSDFLAAHVYWQTPPGAEDNFQSEFWALRFKKYHEKFPHKLIEITEFGNSNGQSPPLSLSREEQARQYQWWVQKVMEFPYLGSLHGFIATSPDRQWVDQGFAWGDEATPFPVAPAVGAIARPARRPDWYYAFAAKLPATPVAPGVQITFPVALTNGGRHPWVRTGAARTIINGKWVDGANRDVGQAVWLLLPSDMVAGERVELKMIMKAPSQPGSYRLRLALYHNGQKEWLHLLDKRTTPDFFPLRVARTSVSPDDGQSPPHTPPDLAATYTPVTVPSRGQAEQAITVELEIRNAGSRRWVTTGAQAGSINLGYHWLDAQGRRVEGRERGGFAAPVEPGQSGRGSVPVRLPVEPGRYTLQLALLSEFERWFDQQLEVAVEVEPSRAPYSVQYSATLPTQMTVGERREVSVQLRNTGGRTWRAQGSAPITLASLWLNEQGQGVQPSLRALLPRDVPPGDTVALPLALLAPAQVGSYRLRLDMAEEGRLFFSQQGNAPFSRTIQVVASASAPAWGAHWLNAQGPESLTSGQAGRMEVRVRNTGQNSWPRARVRLAYRWDNGSPNRVALPADVPPGGETALGLPLNPPASGTYDLTVDLYEEGTGWLNIAAPVQRVTVLESGGSRAVAEPLPAQAAVGGAATDAPADAPVWATSDAEGASGAILTLGQATASDHPERAGLALDNNKLTEWSTGSPQRPGMWFSFDLGSVQPVRAVRVLSRPEQFPRGYLLEGSEDGEGWQALREVPENWSDIAVVLAAPRRLRHVRITQTSHSPWHPWSIRAVYVDVEGRDG